ncbi:hypothetical protein EVAR_85254_1 [Eumeta japonica]|uniref:Uncharacterized protein n=1 Tax=Eumeta variegata TaxID=151549 RepID=A0A4C1VZS0_EUMVA|nr:hypothetical protein EVAR_85254_1 [Eumeta japonica]
MSSAIFCGIVALPRWPITKGVPATSLSTTRTVLKDVAVVEQTVFAQPLYQCHDIPPSAVGEPRCRFFERQNNVYGRGHECGESKGFDETEGNVFRDRRGMYFLC